MIPPSICLRTNWLLVYRLHEPGFNLWLLYLTLLSYNIYYQNRPSVVCDSHFAWHWRITDKLNHFNCLSTCGNVKWNVKCVAAVFFKVWIIKITLTFLSFLFFFYSAQDSWGPPWLWAGSGLMWCFPRSRCDQWKRSICLGKRRQRYSK